jgi:hypothetical protein
MLMKMRLERGSWLFGARSLSFPGMVLAALALAGSVAFAATEPPKQRYHFELSAVTAKPEVKPAIAKLVTPRVEAELKKLFEHHPQLVAKLDAPDPKVDADAYRGFLTKSHIAGSYDVTVEITSAAEELTPMPDKPGTQHLEIRLVLNMTGKTIPDGTLGFVGHGKATIQQEVGAKVSNGEREETWGQVVEVASAAALKNAFQQLDAAPKPKPKSKPKPKQAGSVRPLTPAG